MTISYESVCQELDTLAVQYLTTLAEYTHDWKNTSNEFKQGHLELAHAKYTMGARTISHYSYDERMKALLRLEIDEQDTIISKTLLPTSVKSQQETTNITDKGKDEEKEGLKKRHQVTTKKKNSEWVQLTSNSISDEKHDIELDEKKNKKKIKKNGDPLYWFGLFVSPSLRSSQEHFKSATEQLIRQVNRINELKSIEKRYQELQQEKNLLKLKQTKIQEEDVIA